MILHVLITMLASWINQRQQLTAGAHAQWPARSLSRFPASPRHQGQAFRAASRP